jgi:predicted DNA-binding ribbon-helix-helix protein
LRPRTGRERRSVRLEDAFDAAHRVAARADVDAVALILRPASELATKAEDREEPVRVVMLEGLADGAYRRLILVLRVPGGVNPVQRPRVGWITV